VGANKSSPSLVKRQLGDEVHILVIRLSAMGDVAMTVPVLLALTKQYPKLKITVLTRRFFKPMFSSLPNVIIYEADVIGRHKGISGLWRLYRELKKLDLDAVADLHNVLRSNTLKLFFAVTKTPFVQIDKGRKEKKALTALGNKAFKQLKTTHERYSDVLRELGFPIDLAKVTLLPKQNLSKKSIALIGSDHNKWIGIAPFAAFKGKMYPLDLMEEVLYEMNNTKKYKILLFGGGKWEQQQLNKWANQFSNTVNVAGSLTFEEELGLISNLDLMLSMDSSNGHLAAMYGIPTVTLWGVTHPYAGFYPFAQDPDNALLADRQRFPQIPTSVYGNKLPKGYDKAMDTISPIDIFHTIEEVLDMH